MIGVPIRIRIGWCAWRESNPLPCGPEPRRWPSTAVCLVSAGLSLNSAMGLEVRGMPGQTAASRESVIPL